MYSGVEAEQSRQEQRQDLLSLEVVRSYLRSRYEPEFEVYARICSLLFAVMSLK